MGEYSLYDWTIHLDKDARDRDQYYGLVDNGGDYESVLGFSNGSSPVFALSLQPNPPNDLHSGVGSDLTFTLLE